MRERNAIIFVTYSMLCEITEKLILPLVLQKSFYTCSSELLLVENSIPDLMASLALTDLTMAAIPNQKQQNTVVIILHTR